MLHRYSVSNFQSFLEPVEVSLALNGKVPPTDWEAVSPFGQRLTTALGVIGPNGAGKTALLKPIVFAAWFINESFQAKPDAPIPVSPHFSAADQPVELEFEADGTDGRMWRYVLKATRERVLHEALYQLKERYTYVFIRDWDVETQSYRIKQKDFDFAPKEARRVRPNASLISTAAQYGVELAQYLANLAVQSNIVVSGRLPYRPEIELPNAAWHFSENEAQQHEMTRLLKSWDLGLTDVQLRQIAVQGVGEERGTILLPFGLHAGRDGRSHELSFVDESSGTQSAFVLLSRLLQALSLGGLAVIDEFESDLHPHMLEPILELFASPKTNPKQAQLLFTCHSPEVLNLLHKSQIMLVEKSEACESTAWRMDTVKGIRNDDNFYGKYMAGAYGAVPRL
jgi:uncharacterized protein